MFHRHHHTAGKHHLLFHNDGFPDSPTTVANSSDIKYQKVKGEECAYVTASYFVKEGNSYTRTYEEYVLRKDTNKQWKILGYQLTKGDSSDEQ